MFTGLIEAVGLIEDTARRAHGLRVAIASPLPLGEMVEGESVAVDGVCLTVTGKTARVFCADVVAETLARTRLARVRSGARVNLERSLRLGDRVGGHLLLGHVDATSRVVSVRQDEADWRVRVELPPDLARYVAPKGSVGLQGVSLTVTTADPRTFEVALVPETRRRTTLGDLRPGDPVHVEVDLLARYLESLLRGRGGSSAGGLGPKVASRRKVVRS